jgi:hypothetical protein
MSLPHHVIFYLLKMLSSDVHFSVIHLYPIVFSHSKASLVCCIIICIVTDLINALSDNSPVNMVQHATIDEAVCSMSLGPSSGRTMELCKPLLGNWSVNTFLHNGPCYESGDVINTNGVFCGVRAEELYWRQSALRVSQFSVGDNHGKFIVEEKLKIGLWRFNVWIEDFVCAVVQWYLEGQLFSCVKIRCKETDRETFVEEYPLFISVI